MARSPAISKRVFLAIAVIAYVSLEIVDSSVAMKIQSQGISFGLEIIYPSVLYVAFTAVVAIAFIVSGKRIGSLRSHSAVLPFAAAILGVGLVFLIGWKDAAFVVAGLGCCAIANVLLLFLWMEIVCTLPMASVGHALVGALVASFVVPIASNAIAIVSGGSLVVIACAFVAIASLLYIDRVCGVSLADADTTVSTGSHNLLGVLFGLTITGFAIGCSQSILLQQRAIALPLELVSECATLLLVGFILLRYSDINLSLAVKIVIISVMLCLLVLLFSGSAASLAYVFASVAYSTMWYVGIFACILLAKSQPQSHLVSFGAMEGIFSLSAPVIIILGILDIDISNPVFILVLAAILMMSSICLLGDRNIDALLASKDTKKPGSDSSIDQEILSAAHAHGLTQREIDVYMLYVKGRSAPFIAEKLVVSKNTVKSHLQRIYAKFGVHSRQELISASIGEEVAAKRGKD